jgi:hypothetical protein
MQHLRTTPRAALNLAVRESVIESNPARHIEVTGYRRPHARVPASTNRVPRRSAVAGRRARPAPAYGWRLLFADRHRHAGGPDHYAADLENADGSEVEQVADR